MGVELNNISKSFGAKQVLNRVSLTAKQGSIHGLIGENGAGKSTLMKILTGYLTRSGGTITIEGRTTTLNTPNDAAQLGIGMLYQEPMDFPHLTVLENFSLGCPPLSQDAYQHALSRLASMFHFQLHPRRRVEALTVGERQQIELLRLIHCKTKILILDEPTTGISPKQKGLLFPALKKLAGDGITILLVSHKLEEVATLCDEVTVLRQGAVTHHTKAPFHFPELLAAMFGSVPKQQKKGQARATKKEVVHFHNISAGGERQGLTVNDFSAKSGEIIGLAGLDGAGQATFLRLAAGLSAPKRGTIRLFSIPLPASQEASILAGKLHTVFLPADRLEEALFSGISLSDHFCLRERKNSFWLNGKHNTARAKEAIQNFSIKGTADNSAGELSGGNQQRLLLALLDPGSKLILLENPTRGLDIRSGQWVWNYLTKTLPDDTCILFSSPELDEIFLHSNRILTFFDGAIVKDCLTTETEHDQIAAAMTGMRDQ